MGLVDPPQIRRTTPAKRDMFKSQNVHLFLYIAKNPMTVVVKSAVKDDWVKNVANKATTVDPDDEYCWESLAVGFALGHGMNIEEARDLMHELWKEDLL